MIKQVWARDFGFKKQKPGTKKVTIEE